MLRIFGTAFNVILLSGACSAASLKETQVNVERLCHFSAGYTLSTQIDPILKYLFDIVGDSKGDPVSKELLCIYEGTVGTGIDTKKGCIAGIFDLRDQSYGSIFEANAFNPNLAVAEGKKCSSEVAHDLLFSKRLPQSNFGTTIFEVYFSGKLSYGNLYSTLPISVVNDKISYKNKFNESVQKHLASKNLFCEFDKVKTISTRIENFQIPKIGPVNIPISPNEIAEIFKLLEQSKTNLECFEEAHLSLEQFKSALKVFIERLNNARNYSVQ